MSGRPGPAASSPPGFPNAAAREWIDVTEMFREVAGTLSPGTLVHSERFRLHDAMLAVEVMNPQMDSSMRTGVRVESSDLPVLGKREVLRLMDIMVAALASWLEGNGLGETIYGARYLTDIELEIDEVLRVFLKGVEAAAWTVSSVVKQMGVADEEDLLGDWKGKVIHFDEEDYADEVERLLTTDLKEKEEDAAVRRAMFARLRFIRDFLVIVLSLWERSRNRLEDVRKSVEDAEGALSIIGDTLSLCSKELPAGIFDPNMNRQFSPSMPQRNMELMSSKSSLEYFSKLLKQFTMLVEVKPVVLPYPSERKRSEEKRFSFQCCIYAVRYFSAKHKPNVLVRSLLSRLIMYPAKYPFSEPSATPALMMLTDLGLSMKGISWEEVSVTHAMGKYGRFLLSTLCRTRGRQHRCLLDFLVRWERAAVSYIEDLKRKMDGPSLNTGQGGSAAGESMNGVAELEAQEKNMGITRLKALEIILFEVSCQAMIAHLFLGFECELYCSWEYPPVYFYLAYILSTLTSATYKLSEKRELHGARIALHLLDEGRLWLCRAFIAFLDALSESAKWSYSWRRLERKEGEKKGCYGGERLWYDQRFLDMGTRAIGPPFVDYDKFVEMLANRKKEIQQRCAKWKQDIFLTQLAEASDSFRSARTGFERARQMAKAFQWEPILNETIALARVAVANSIVLMKISEMHKQGYSSSSCSSPVKPDFDFRSHPHFPIITIAAQS